MRNSPDDVRSSVGARAGGVNGAAAPGTTFKTVAARGGGARPLALAVDSGSFASEALRAQGAVRASELALLESNALGQAVVRVGGGALEPGCADAADG
jgi:hypothetical protein